jgi:hypothetical protein
MVENIAPLCSVGIYYRYIMQNLLSDIKRREIDLSHVPALLVLSVQIRLR